LALGKQAIIKKPMKREKRRQREKYELRQNEAPSLLIFKIKNKKYFLII